VNLLDVFRAKGQQLFWHRLPDDHVHPAPAPSAFTPESTYLVVRLKEMYLAQTRKLWRKFYPMLHGYTSWGEEEHAVAGPGQLKDLGDANLDRIVNLNHRLAGPLPYRGQDITVLVGLYAVPGQDAAKALITTVGALASLGGPALGSAQQIAGTVKQGVESILGLEETRLQLGIRDTFYQHNPLAPGYHVGIAATRHDVDANALWLSKGRLVTGADPIAGQPYTAHDYMVLELERRETHEDWPSLPGLAEVEALFAAVMADNGLTVDQQRTQLGSIWPAFTEALRSNRYLVQQDRERIALSVEQDLQARLVARERGNPFETRSWSGGAVERKAPEAYDFLDVADYLDPDDAGSRKLAEAALGSNPFPTSP
jgi:hypothetical protein